MTTSSLPAGIDEAITPNYNVPTHPTPRYPRGVRDSIFSPATRITIHKPIDVIWGTITNTHSWKLWNSFTPDTFITGHVDDPTKSSSGKGARPIIEDIERQHPESSERTVLSLGTYFTMNARMGAPTASKPEPETTPTAEIVTSCQAPITYTSTSQSTDPSVGSQIRILRTASVSWAVNNNKYSFLGTKWEVAQPKWWINCERMTVLTEWTPVADAMSEEPDVSQVYTTVQSWEGMGGIVSYLIKWLYEGRLNEMFGEWAAGLKKYCESL